MMRDAVMGIGRALRMIVTAPWMAWALRRELDRRAFWLGGQPPDEALRQELLDALRRARRPRGGKR